MTDNENGVATQPESEAQPAKPKRDRRVPKPMLDETTVQRLKEDVNVDSKRDRVPGKL